MKFNAYVLIADPSWIEASVKSYYAVINNLYVCYDADGRSWSGTDISQGITESLERLRKIDSDNKIIELSGSFSRNGNPRECESSQREFTLKAAAQGADWIFQFDTDEVIPNVKKVISVLGSLPQETQVVYWPMRCLYNFASDGRFLEVCNRFGGAQAEYPGAIAVRAGTKLDEMRHLYNNSHYVRLLRWPPRRSGDVPLRYHVLPRDAVLHFSWVRSPEALKSKMSSWGHSDQINPTETYINWANSPKTWQTMRNFHPMKAELWPRLRRVRLPYVADWDTEGE